MTDGALDTLGVRPTIRLERHLVDPPAAVWEALTDRKKLQQWFPCDVIVAGGRWEPGASISFPFPPETVDMTLAGEVRVVDAPRTLAFTWGTATLRFELSPDGSGTLLVLIDELDPSSAARNAAGWDGCLDRLTGAESEPNAWRRRFDAYAAAFEPRIGPQEGPPATYRGG